MAGRQQPSWHYGASWSSAGYAPVDALKSEQPRPEAPRSSTPKRRQEFRPWAHRTISLVLLAIVSLALIGLIEYGLHVLPQASLNLGAGLSEPIQPLHKRAAAPSSSSSISTSSTSSTFTSTSVASASATPARATSIPAGSTPEGSAAPPTMASNPDNSGDSDGAGVGAAGTSFPVDASTTSGAYLPTQGTTVIITPSPLPPPAQQDTSVTPQAAETPTSVPPGTNPKPTSNNDGTNQPIAGTDTGTGSGTTVEGSPNSSPSQTSGMQPQPSRSGAKSLTSSPTNTLLNPTSSAASSSVSSAAPDASEAALLSSVPLSLIGDQGIFFLGVYAPVLIAIVVRLAAHHLYRSTRLVDPFAVLSQPGGAAFEEFFWSHHLGHESILAPYHAFRSQRWIILWTLVLYYATQLLAPFGSELTASFWSHYNFHTAEESGYVEGPALWIAVPIARILQGLLGFTFLQLVNIWILLRSYRSGLRTNPASISTIASLTGHPGTAGDFSQAARLRHRRIINETFAVQRYTIASYTMPETNGDGYGIVSLDRHGELSPRADPLPTPLTTSSSTHSTDTSSWRSSMKRDEILDLIIASVAAMILFGLILTYYLNSAPTSFEKFMDSQTFGPRFLLTILTLILKTPLLSLCARTTATIPFARLAKRPRAAQLDLLQPVPITALGSISYTLRRFEWYATSLSVTAGLVIELLLILIPGVPFQAHETIGAAHISWYGCLGCLSLILLVIIAGWLRLIINKSFGVHGWPRLPISVGAIAMYVADSNMASDCAATNRASLQVQGARYQFARLDGRWLVDYAEHATGAEHGLRHKESGVLAEEVRLRPKGSGSLSEDPSIAYGVPSYDYVVGRDLDSYEQAPDRSMHSYERPTGRSMHSYERSTRRGMSALEPAVHPSAHARRPSSVSMQEWRSYHSQSRSVVSPDLLSLHDYIVHHGAE